MVPIINQSDSNGRNYILVPTTISTPSSNSKKKVVFFRVSLDPSKIVAIDTKSDAYRKLIRTYYSSQKKRVRPTRPFIRGMSRIDLFGGKGVRSKVYRKTTNTPDMTTDWECIAGDIQKAITKYNVGNVKKEGFRQRKAKA